MNALPLQDRAILDRQLELACDASRVDIVTYGFGAGTAAINLLYKARRARVIIGGILDSSKAQGLAQLTQWPSREPPRIRYLEGCHSKLFVACPGKITVAIIGSMNLGAGATFETAVELHGKPAEFFASLFNSYWRRAEPVEPLDLETISKTLESSEFMTGKHFP